MKKIKAKHEVATLNIIYYKACGKISVVLVRKIQTIYLMTVENSIVEIKNTFSIKIFSPSKSQTVKK